MRKETANTSRDVKYIGMDVHKDAIAVAVLNSAGKVVMESVIETKAPTVVQLVHGLRGELHVTFEEGTWAAWLYDLLKRFKRSDDGHRQCLRGHRSVIASRCMISPSSMWLM